MNYETAWKEIRDELYSIVKIYAEERLNDNRGYVNTLLQMLAMEESSTGGTIYTDPSKFWTAADVVALYESRER